ncbi:MAG: hypothetical protein R3Y58_12730 [Eubacteriales bacterium]
MEDVGDIEDMDVVGLLAKIRNQIEYDKLCNAYGVELIDGLMSLFEDVFYTTNKTLRVGGVSKSIVQVRERFMKLDNRISDIRYNVKKERLEKARLKIQNNSRARDNKDLLEHNVKLESENVELMEQKVTLTDKNEELQDQQVSLKQQCYQLEQEYESKQAYLDHELKQQVAQVEEAVEDWGKIMRYVSSLEDTYENSREWQLDEPSGFMTARTYKEKIVDPLVRRLKEVIVNLARKCSWLEKQLQKKEYENHQLSNLVSQHKDDKQYWEYLTKDMRVKADKYDVLERGMGTEQIEHVMKVVEERERGWR